MEVFTSDHGLPSDVVLFPDTHLSPFDLPTATDHHKISTDNHHFLSPQPPQKLRPIRCNVRSFSDRCSSDEAKPLSWQSEAGLYNNTETDSGSFIPPKPSTLDLSSKECQIEAAVSSSSSEEEEISKLQESFEGPINKKKRKRKSRRKLELFIENMMKTVIEKQEEMHKQLIEILEKKEKESIMREEAWKKQEIERAKRDDEARKQQVSHNLALISFIQNSLGQKIPNALHKQENSKKNDDLEMNNIEESDIKRWPKSEVQALITVRAALNHKFNGKGPKGSIWEEVASGLSGMGYNRTPKKCKEKWENINKYYRRTMEKGKEKSSKVCEYFSELEMLHKTAFISASHDEGHSLH